MQIHLKLFLMLCGFSLLILTVMVLTIQWSIGRGMVDYVNQREINALRTMANQLEQKYLEQQSWLPLQGQHRVFRALISENLSGTVFRKDPRRTAPASDHSLQPAEQRMQRMQPVRPQHAVSYALLDQDKRLVVGHYPEGLDYSYLPLNANNQQVGYLAVSKRSQLAAGYELDFIQSQQLWLWSAALGLLLVILLLSFPLAKHLVAPILQLRSAMQRAKQGEFVLVPPSKRTDEFGQLDQDYNHLVAALNANEQARKRWLADISHELRTPIAIIRGELEAMLDEVRPVSVKGVSSVHAEVLRLQGLTEDLHALTSAEIGGMEVQLQQIDFQSFLQAELQNYQGYLTDAGIRLICDDHSGRPLLINADPKRLNQLFNNLLSNVVHYANASEVRIQVRTEQQGATALLRVQLEDNGRGVALEHLPMLFDPLFRTDSARQRVLGGTGLGLAICAHIVQCHAGQIQAYQVPSGGLGILIRLPLLQAALQTGVANHV